MSNDKKPQYVDQIVIWESTSQDDGKPYLSIHFNEDFTFKKGDKLFVSQNRFHADNPKAPKWKKSKKIEEDNTSSLVQDFEELIKPAQSDELPF